MVPLTVRIGRGRLILTVRWHYKHLQHERPASLTPTLPLTSITMSFCRFLLQNTMWELLGSYNSHLESQVA